MRKLKNILVVALMVVALNYAVAFVNWIGDAYPDFTAGVFVTALFSTVIGALVWIWKGTK